MRRGQPSASFYIQECVHWWPTNKSSATASSSSYGIRQIHSSTKCWFSIWGWHSDSTLSLLRSLYPFSLPRSQWDSWIYSTISSLALCCAEQSILQQTGPLYKVLHQLQMRDRLGGAWDSNIGHTEVQTGWLVVQGNDNVKFLQTRYYGCTDLVKLCIFPSLKGSGQGFLL